MQGFSDLPPGMLYVVATLLPLASFLLLALIGATRAAARPYRDSDGFGATLYRLLGGDSPGRGGAYVATAAMVLAFVLSVVGYVLYTRDEGIRHHAEEQLHEFHAGKEHKAEARDKVKALEREIEHIDARWNGQLDWARIGPRSPLPPNSESHVALAAVPGTLLQVGFHIDSLAAIMFLMVTLIASLIHLFSIGYMGEELDRTVTDHQVHTEEGHLHRRGRFGRFFMFLSLFCFSMLNLVLADNLFQVFVSWELVGICSYLLIGFYYERTSASNAANKAFITNRVGDAGFIIGLLIIWTYLGTLNFDQIFKQVRAPLRDHFHSLAFAAEVVRADVVKVDAATGTKTLQITNHADPETQPGSAVVLFPIRPPSEYHAPHAGEEFEAVAHPTPDQSGFTGDKAMEGEHGSMPYWLLVAAGLGIFLGCVGKSAQFPLQVWLPDAMEGPTPVSALIHAATMVAAGVYLVGRVYPLFTPESRLVIAYTGGITLFVAATVAIVMTDIKKVLAYSTVSQLGYMMLALGVGGWAAGLFHLLTHAFFKALLFLGSGSVIYGCHHEQEMTKMGGLYPKMKITAITMLIGVFTIAGTPLFAGWYSKDAILAQALGYVRLHPEHFLLFGLPLVTAAITTFYMFRMWFMTFTGEPRDAHVYEHAHESPWTMTVPLIVLAFFSVTVAWGWPIHDAEASHLEGRLHHSQHPAVLADFGITETESGQVGALFHERHYAQMSHPGAGALAFLAMVLGAGFSALIYYYRKLDPAEAVEQFPAVHRFLGHKWYFDELYSAIVVRPSLVVAGWCRAFDTYVIDGIANFLGWLTVWFSKWNGKFDFGIIDGLVNLTARVVNAVGYWLRGAQTGYIRSYILFLVLAAIGIFALLSYFVTLATAG
jgi:NADH-quinone oxidoreductase subunit L